MTVYAYFLFFLQHLGTFSGTEYLFRGFLGLDLAFCMSAAILWLHETSLIGPGHAPQPTWQEGGLMQQLLTRLPERLWYLYTVTFAHLQAPSVVLLSTWCWQLAPSPWVCPAGYSTHSGRPLLLALPWELSLMVAALTHPSSGQLLVLCWPGIST